MGYADIEDLKARAGRLRDAWDDSTQPNDGDLSRFLRDASAEIDVAFALHGLATPVADATAAAALRVVAADIALLAAVTATWPGGGGPAAVSDLIGDVRARVEGPDGKGGWRGALKAGDLPAIILLTRGEEQFQSAGASNFWSKEADYSALLDDIESGNYYIPGYSAGGGYIWRTPTGPEFHKGQKL